MESVTVVIPTRNRWSRLSSAALPAATSQQDVGLDIVVVDDGSTDETPTRLRELEAADPRVRIVRNESRRGVAAARNAGIAAAAGEWVAFLDDDDLWSPEKLARQLDAARAASASFVYAGAVVLDAHGAAIGEERPPDPRDVVRTLLARNLIPAGCSNVMARTAVLRRLGGFDERLFQLADWDLWLRLALAERAGSTPEILVGYVTHPANMVVQTRSDVMDELTYLERKHADVANEYGIAFDRLWVARWVAGSNRRAGRRVRAAGVYLRAGLVHRSRADVVRAGAVLARPLVPRALAQRVHERRRRRSDGSGATVPGAPPWLERYRPLAFERVPV